MVQLVSGFASSAAAARSGFRAIILGAPGSGKGTISARIVDLLRVTHISTGDKLRQHIADRTELGERVKRYLDSGNLVPDDVMINLIDREINALKGKNNWLLDGFPRTLSQAEALQRIQPVCLVINVDIPHRVIIDRLKNRWVHLPSGRVYNLGFNDPKVPGRDDVTNEPLSQRPDDRPEIVEKRLQRHAEMSASVIAFYERLNLLKSFSGETTDSIWPSIQQHLTQFLEV
ncbi:GTP:AMP phosphotransferase AK3, mitochondrial-like [Trichogramma pretiosum]|uniref:GTP:AMP phosphotransferase AK3, mitochondrial-like n=1 Tax=Trichogramma pretiosum TaxID=7493 RepID=UPI0006C9549F|nr:GTP:AMP phosphotransferase AK3, mitochondrial-like [Trichogramma pretiosum]XP_014232722.1 GTP:AMP phosphotransferase AK3, mitochondrial-like [Trichogramma pretiosum]XP_023317418.1 GTP:AMP phosphotransferase AK3, mitochondrial-like [Trichogramma pretiosum]